MPTRAEREAAAAERKNRRRLEMAAALWWATPGPSKSDAEAQLRNAIDDASATAWKAGLRQAVRDARAVGLPRPSQLKFTPRRFAAKATEDVADYATRAKKVAEAGGSAVDVDYAIARISNSTTYEAFNASRLESVRAAASDSDLVLYRVWQLGSERPCGVCAPMSGERVHVSQSYSNGMEPGSVHQNCLCTESFETGGFKMSTTDTTAETSTLDTGPSDVHMPSASNSWKRGSTPSAEDLSNALTKSARRKVRKAARAARLAKQVPAVAQPKAGKRMRGGGRLRMAVTHPDGTRFEVRHMTAAYSDKEETLHVYFALDKNAALADDDGKKKVWVQVARLGRWLGHWQGAFELTSNTLDSLVHNFKSEGVRLQYDFEHASAMKPSDGDIPTKGAPAQGWIYDLKHEGGALYALTEWLPLAREYIKNDQYAGVSPAIGWKNKDRVTGEPIGPKLQSVALTNSPFITGMRPPMAASTGAAVWLTEETPGTASTLSDYCYSTAEYMPKVKAALRLSDLATPQECSEHFARLCDRYSNAGGDMGELHDGYPIHSYMGPLRDMASPGLGTTWDDLISIIQDHIDQAIEEHEAEGEMEPDADDMHASSAEPAASTTLTAEPTAPAATDPVNILQTITIPEPAVTPPSTSQEEATTMADPVAPTPAASVADPVPAPAPAPVATLAHHAEVSTLTLRLNASEAENRRLADEVVTLRAWKDQREETDLANEVSIAFETYKDKKGIKPEQKSAMLSMLKSNPDAFRDLYPPTPLSQQHLLKNLTGASRSPTATSTPPVRTVADQPNPFGAEPQRLSLRQLSHQIARKRNIPLATAQLEAERIIESQRRAG